jgi:hypothetical protein
MIEPVFGFEQVFFENVVMGYMAVVAGGHPAVRIVCPVGIVGNHHMAIDAGFGFIAKI